MLSPLEVVAFASFTDDGAGVIEIARAVGVAFIGANAPGSNYLVELAATNTHQGGDAPSLVTYAVIQAAPSLGGKVGVMYPSAVLPNVWALEFTGVAPPGAFRAQFIVWRLAPGTAA